MSKYIELVCEYCKMGIKETDMLCPNCGANCSHAIKEYKKKIEEEKLERKKAMQNVSAEVSKSFVKVFIIIGAIVLIFIILAVFIFSSLVYSSFNRSSNHSSTIADDSKKHGKAVTVGYNKLAKGSYYNVILNEYELYEYKSDDFPESYNTKQGYQKVAFRFLITNTSDEPLNIFYDAEISLTADDYPVESSNLEVCTFCYTVTGKDKYPPISMPLNVITSGDSLQGYVGYLVPIDAKNLKFKVGEDITIKMDNPAYNG